METIDHFIYDYLRISLLAPLNQLAHIS